MRSYKFWIGALGLALILAAGALTGVAPASWLKTDYGLTNLGSLNLVPDSNAATAFRVQNSNGVAVQNITPAGAYSLSNSSGTEQFAMAATGALTGPTVAIPLTRHIENWHSGTRSGDLIFRLPDEQASWTVQRFTVQLSQTAFAGAPKFHLWQSGNLPAIDSKELVTCDAPFTFCEDETFTWFDTLTGGRSIHVRLIGGTRWDSMNDVTLWVHKSLGSAANRY